MALNRTKSINYIKRASKLGPLGLAIFLQLLIILLATFVIVLVPESPVPTQFSAKKNLYLPHIEREHSAALAAYQSAVSAPMQLQRIETAALLTDLPSFQANDLTSDRLQATNVPTNSAWMGTQWSSGFATLNAESSSTLFGLEASGERIVILFDNSLTVWNRAEAVGISSDRFVAELSRMIEDFGVNTEFALVPFAQKVGTFKDYLIPATQANRQAAIKWLQKNVRAQGKHTELPYQINGIQGALTLAYQMQPDLIFILSDGDFQRTKSQWASGGDVPWPELRASIRKLKRRHAVAPQIHFVGFQVSAAASSEIKRLVAQERGQFKALNLQ